MSAALDLASEVFWTPDALDEALSASRTGVVDWRRFQIVDGALVVSPPPLPRHEALVVEIAALLRNAVPPGFRTLGAAGIVVGASYLVSDVTVVAEEVLRQTSMRVQPSDVLLAVEIESSSSITTDRITKPAQYAAAGIGHYWRVETDPLRLIAYCLDGNVYAEVGAWGADEIARISEPVEVEIDISSLLPA